MQARVLSASSGRCRERGGPGAGQAEVASLSLGSSWLKRSWTELKSTWPLPCKSWRKPRELPVSPREA